MRRSATRTRTQGVANALALRFAGATSVVLLTIFFGCGVDVIDASFPTEDASPTNNNNNDSGIVDASGLNDTTSPSLSDGGEAGDGACATNNLLSCGTCGAACPAGSTECLEGVCMGRTTVSVTLDGISQLQFTGGSVKWHHTEYVPPGTTTINGTAWSPQWPNGTVDCNCDSTSTSFLPALPARAQTVTTTQTRGRFPIIPLQPAPANNFTFSLNFNDDKSGVDLYEVSFTYATR